MTRSGGPVLSFTLFWNLSSSPFGLNNRVVYQLGEPVDI